ncbi:hypothetical protein [Burkholderia gladioli]|uniref:hypothetical protein n=1 Tax=Burkholderia gladioli TaxID=28095 RepID=UPI0016409BF5|nr:hypothetical protein [Burkholderia gladioli]
MICSESTRAFGQPRDTNPTFGVWDIGNLWGCGGKSESLQRFRAGGAKIGACQQRRPANRPSITSSLHPGPPQLPPASHPTTRLPVIRMTCFSVCATPCSYAHGTGRSGAHTNIDAHLRARMPPPVNCLPSSPSATASGDPAASTAHPGSSTTPAAPAPSQQSRRGPLDALSSLASRMGTRKAAGDENRGCKENPHRTRAALAKTEAVIGPTASAGYELWAANNATSAVNGIVSTFHGANPATQAVSSAANGVGMLPQTLDIVSTGVGYANKTLKVGQTHADAKQARPGTLAGNDAPSAHAQAKEALAKATPGAIRDVGLGAAGLAGRIHSAADHGKSLYGGGALTADGALVLAGGAAYISAGALQNRGVNQSVDRMQALRSAVTRPPSARQDVGSAATRQLDALFASDKLDANVYSILRTRSEPEIARFLEHHATLGLAGQQKLRQVLHFPGERNMMQVLNLGRTSNINTASMRRSAREAVIDAFIGMEVRPGRTEPVMDQLKTARAEALGRPMAPAVAAVETQMRAAGIDTAHFAPGSLRAIAASGDAAGFIQHYQALPAEDRTKLHAALHFGSWRFWKADATLPTTRPQRADIRAALVSQFAKGASVDRLAALKLRYNEKVLPLQTGRTHARPAVPDTLRAHILAHQDLKLDSLKEEKRHAKIQMGYGTAIGALTIAELAVNPAAGAGISASRAVMSPVHLAYAGRRGVVAEINARKARPIDGSMREEALLRAMPTIHARIAEGQAAPARLADPAKFMKDTLALSPAQIGKLDALQRSGDTAAAQALLKDHAPDVNARIALRVLAEQSTGASGNAAQQAAARAFLQDEARASGDPQLAQVAADATADQVYAQLNRHFLEGAALNPKASLPALAQRLSAGGNTAALDAQLGFDTRAYQGQAPERIAEQLATLFAQDNPVYATRLFAAQLAGLDGTASPADARNTLRDFRFSETEIQELAAKPPAEAADWLNSHLFGENLRRRFSNAVLDPRGVAAATRLAERMPQHAANAREPLTWRLGLEQAGAHVIDNAGSPGLDSMLHALHQQLSGSTAPSPGASSRKVMEARRRVLAEVTAGQVDRHVDVTRDADTIVRIAAATFGKPGATAKIVKASGGGHPTIAGGDGIADASRIAAVLVHDQQTGRSFVLHGGDAAKLDATHQPADRQPPGTSSSTDGSTSSDAPGDDAPGDDARAARSHSHGNGPARVPNAVPGNTTHQPLRAGRRRQDPNAVVTGNDEPRDWLPELEFGSFSKDLLGSVGIDLPDGEALLPASAVSRAAPPTTQAAASSSRLATVAAASSSAQPTDEIHSLADLRRFITETGRAYDLTHTLAEAGHLQAGQAADGHDDPTGATVNATRVPDSAIVGWVRLLETGALAGELRSATPEARASLLAELVKSDRASVHLNDGRASMED